MILFIENYLTFVKTQRSTQGFQYDWYDHPLKKTYPLQGDEAASWYEVDKIYGKEARDIIGPELRDTARVDRYDSERFARLGFEVPKGTKITGDEAPTKQDYQEGAFDSTGV